MRYAFLFLSVFLSTAAGAEPLKPATTQKPILMDGRCDDAAYTDATTIALASRSTLHLLEDELYLYVCIAYPPESWGAGDLYFTDPAGGGTLNLHVSAQKGERQQQADGSWPDYIWENNVGWYGNVVVMRWNAEDGFSCCHASAARELQIAKAKIANAAGAVRMMLDMRVIMTEAGERTGQAVFPEGASLNNPATWQDLALQPLQP